MVSGDQELGIRKLVAFDKLPLRRLRRVAGNYHVKRPYAHAHHHAALVQVALFARREQVQLNVPDAEKLVGIKPPQRRAVTFGGGDDLV